MGRLRGDEGRAEDPSRTTAGRKGLMRPARPESVPMETKATV
nr:hypothetical protein [Alkalicoccus halolimnae]